MRGRSFAYEGLPDSIKSDEGSDSITPEKAFRSSLVLQLLAQAHLRTCSGSVNVPALELSVKEYQARGAIALCLSAVSRFSIMVLLILTCIAGACHQDEEDSTGHG